MKKMKKIKFILLIAAVVIGLSAYFFIYRPYVEISQQGKAVLSSAKELKAAFLENDIDLVKNKLQDFSGAYAAFQKSAKSVYWASFIPYVADFKNGVEAGTYLIVASTESIEAIYPYADLIGFKKGEASFIERSAEDRLQTAIVTLDKVLTKVDVVSENINQAELRINKIDPNRYPEKIGNIFIRARISNLKDQFEGLSSLFVNAKPLLKKIPELFGKDKEKTYLILFQNENEQRATGGFLTAYGVFKVRNGKIRIERSSDIYSLDASIPYHPAAPDKIFMYHKGVSNLYIRDANISPDLTESLKLFNTLYERSSDKVKYDGVVTLDTKVLVDMLTIFGDTEADGVIFSAKNDDRCDCAQVIYKLFDMVDRPVGYVKENRKGILGDLMYALFYKAIGFSPSKYWGTLAQTLLKDLDEKHILLNFSDPDVQQSIEKLNYGGRVRDYDGDYLHVNNVNFAGAKSNLFVTQYTSSKTIFKGSEIEREVIVEFKNPYPPSDCNLERGGLCLNAILRNWVRIYVPKGSKLVSFKGSEKKVLTYDELGKTVYEGFLQVSPQGKAQIIVTYTLPSAIDRSSYRLLIQKQPGEQKGQLKAIIDGSKVYDDVLDKDKELKK